MEPLLEKRINNDDQKSRCIAQGNSCFEIRVLRLLGRKSRLLMPIRQASTLYCVIDGKSPGFH